MNMLSSRLSLSAGDLLRAEQAREGSQYGQLIAEYIKEGNIVPQEITIALLQNAMREALNAEGKTLAGHDVPARHKSKWSGGKGRFLIDGFPRKMDQAVGFDDTVGPVAEQGRKCSAATSMTDDCT